MHAERMARLERQQQQQQEQEQAERKKREEEVSAAAQAKGGGGEEEDEMAAIEAAIAANARMTELPNPPSEATKARLYGWDRNLAQRKDLQARLGSRLAESAGKRQGKGKGGKGGEERKGGSGGRR